MEEEVAVAAATEEATEVRNECSCFQSHVYLQLCIIY